MSDVDFVSVKILDGAGAEVALDAAKHKLDCQHSPCRFRNCGCGPIDTQVSALKAIDSGGHVPTSDRNKRRA